MAGKTEPPKPETEDGSPIVDAYYKPKDQSPKLPRVYDYTKEIPVEKTEGGDRAATVFALCLACVILGIGLGSIRSRETRVENAREPVDRIVSAMTSAAPTPVVVEAPAEEKLSSVEIYDIAEKQTVEVLVGGNTVGSGTILTDDGIILTNAHLLGSDPESASVAVTLYSGELYSARLMGYERFSSDLAILKINGDGLPVPVTGDSDELDVGDRVYAVGHSRGEACCAMSEGMVTDREQEMTVKNQTVGQNARMSFFRISAPVKDENSGGPVYNERGEIVGIVTAYSLQVDSLTYCIPINDAVLVAQKLTENRFVGGTPRMGIIGQTVSETVADYYNRYSPDSMVPGVQVYAIDSNGCAEAAGMQRGDIIVRFGSYNVTTEEELAAAEKEYSAGEDVAVTVFRGGEYLQMSLRLKELLRDGSEEFSRQAAIGKEY